MTDERPNSGFRNFFLMWLGQVVSLVGSGLTAFAMGVWVYQRTGDITLFTLIAVSASLPAIVLSPFAGALVDRFDRRWMIVVSDLGAAVGTGLLLLLLWLDSLAMWQIYAIVALSSAFNTLQFPAFGAAITLLVPKTMFGRASGMMQFGQSGAQVLAPLMAGYLMVALSITGVLAIDLATFVFAVVLLFFVRVPRPAAPRAGAPGAVRPSLWREAGYGWTYIRERPALLGLLAYFSGINLLVPMGMVLTTPLVLSFTDAADLGLVLSISSAGMVIGSLVMIAWGGPKRRMRGVLGFAPLITVGLIVAGLQPSVTLIAAGMFIVFASVPVINGSSQAIWQSKVEPHVQGRVFAMRRMVAQITAPVAFFLAGPLAQRVFVPLLEPGGALADSVGRFLGTGDGRGIGLLFIVMGVVFLAGTGFAFAVPRLRRLEDLLPDVVGDAKPAGAAGKA